LESAFGASAPPQSVPDAYSIGPAVDQGRVAQAGHAGDPSQKVQQGTTGMRIDETNIARLIAEENESKSKFPKYPGLERWDLVEKMGDGAFSNVYRGVDREGKVGEVAIKVVRKYEMNNMQVSFLRRVIE
jgi:serine/threonine-protein kinase RCK2